MTSKDKKKENIFMKFKNFERRMFIFKLDVDNKYLNIKKKISYLKVLIESVQKELNCDIMEEKDHRPNSSPAIINTQFSRNKNELLSTNIGII